jgi:hypothetical protein
MPAQAETYGPYSLRMNITTGGLVISRQDSDHKRTVALITTLQQWDTFTAALAAGKDEVAAVHAIDE